MRIKLTLIVFCFSSLVSSLGVGASPPLGRPRLRGAFLCFFGFFSAFSRASIAVESREIWPIKRSD